MVKHFCTATVFLFITCLPTLADGFSRGPLLQQLGRDRVMICWDTQQPRSAEITLLRGRQQAQRITAPQSTRQRIAVEGLKPGTRYHYTVRLSDGATDGGQFTTAPLPGKPFSFAAWGDSRSNPDACKKIADLVLKSGAGMCVHSGDYVSCGPKLEQWDTLFFQPCHNLMRSVVLWPVVGNHEIRKSPTSKVLGRDVFRDNFELPNGKIYYSFDYGDAHFLVLDSNPDASSNREQYAFAEKDLAASNALWKFAVWHDPVFNSGVHGSQIDMRTRYCPMLAKYNVDMLITGHLHAFEISRPVIHLLQPGQKRPYIQLITGGGGAPNHQNHEGELWSGRGGSFRHFVLFTVNGSHLQAKVIREDGSTAETFDLDKSQPPAGQVAYEAIELQRIWQEKVQALTALKDWIRPASKRPKGSARPPVKRADDCTGG